METFTINDKTKNSNVPNDVVSSFIVSSLSANVSNTKFVNPKTELDSHANMAVLGSNCFVFEYSSRTCEVSAFSPNLTSSTLPIVDTVIIYDCPYTFKSYLLMVRNALYLKEAYHNLIPPFLMREAGIIVNNTAKIHAPPPVTEDHHSVFFPNDGLRIPLKLDGTFSYFNHRLPQLDEICRSCF